MRRIHGIRIPLLAVVVAGTLLSQAAAAQPAGPHSSVTGTVCRIDTRAGAIDLLTAVGHAVRIQHVVYSPGIKVMSGPAEVGMSAIIPGTVCRIDCDVSGSRTTATGVVILQPAPRGSQ